MSQDEELLRIEELKKKLFSKNIRTSGTHDEALHSHAIDVSTNWDDVDEKIKAEKEKQQKIKEEERSQSGAGSLYDTGMGKGIYGHYSQADSVEGASGISTSVQSGSIEKKQSIGQFLSEKFSQDRADATKKRLAAQDVTLKYAAAQAQKSIYPNLQKKETVAEADTIVQTENENNANKPEMHVYRVGDRNITQLSKGLSSDKNKVDVETLTKGERELMREQKAEKTKRVTFGSIVFTAISLFFVGALGYAYIHFQNGTNVISPDKINIEVTGPVSVVSGEASEFLIDITNNNSAELIQSDLVIQFPDGTKNPEDRTQNLNNQRIDIGSVPPGQTVRRKVSAVFFGEENVKKNIMYSFEFNIADSLNIFNKDKIVGVTIAGSPLITKITNVKEITNNKELVFDVEVVSNSNEIIKNVQLKVDYPFGYKLTESNIKPVGNNNVWNIGDIEALGARTIKLKGVLLGTSNLDKNFRFTIGVADPKTGDMSTIIATQDQKVSIKDPFVMTILSINSSPAGSVPVSFGGDVEGVVSFTNNLKNTLTDVVVEVRVAGTLVNRTTIDPEQGFYRSSDDIMFWDQSQKQELAIIPPGQSRDVGFRAKVVEGSEDLMRALRRSASSFVVTIKAKRLNENNVPEEITYDTSREIRLTTNISMEAFMTHVSGPVPARVNEETVLRFNARIKNTVNTAKGTVFTAKLPPNVVWKNSYSSNLPKTGVTYNSSKREITLLLGEIPAGTGTDTSPIEFYFDVGITPSLTQKNTTPSVILNPVLGATDSFTETVLQTSLDGLTTEGAGGGDVQ